MKAKTLSFISSLEIIKKIIYLQSFHFLLSHFADHWRTFQLNKFLHFFFFLITIWFFIPFLLELLGLDINYFNIYFCFKKLDFLFLAHHWILWWQCTQLILEKRTSVTLVFLAELLRVMSLFHRAGASAPSVTREHSVQGCWALWGKPAS